MERRDFIKKTCTACLSVTVLASLATSCNSTRYLSGKLANDGIIIDKDDFKVKQKGGTAYSSFIIVRNSALLFPLCVYRLTENKYSALWMKCSHQGAELQVSGDVLQCSAHGSEFNNQGQVITGPAINRLRKFPVVVNNNEIFIDLRKES